MPNVTLVYSPTCGACPSAKSLWKELRVQYSFSYREVDITTPDGQELADRHSIRAVPATIIDGRLTFIGVPSRQSAEKALQLRVKREESTVPTDCFFTGDTSPDPPNEIRATRDDESI